jgi:hypothetical protein
MFDILYFEIQFFFIIFQPTSYGEMMQTKVTYLQKTKHSIW